MLQCGITKKNVWFQCVVRGDKQKIDKTENCF